MDARNEIRPSATLAEALAKMLRNKVDYLIVRTEHAIAGVLSYRSLLEAQLDRGFASLLDVQASQALTESALVVERAFRLEDALRAVREREITVFVVRLAEGNLGLITKSDLLRILEKGMASGSGNSAALMGEPLGDFLERPAAIPA